MGWVQLSCCSILVISTLGRGDKGRSEVWGHPWLHSKFNVSLRSTRPRGGKSWEYIEY